jgi:hypothetical protein
MGGQQRRTGSSDRILIPMRIRNVLPEPLVLGRKLKPYTLGHDLLLHAVDSGFAIGAKNDPSYSDLITSVYLCSFYYDEAINQLCSKRLTLRLSLWGWSRRGYDLQEEVKGFVKYIKAFTDAPDYWIENVQEAKGNARQDTPFSQTLKIFLMREFHVPEDVALNTPFHEAQLNYLSHLEMNGRIRFVTEEDKAAIAAAYDPTFHERLQQIVAARRN